MVKTIASFSAHNVTTINKISRNNCWISSHVVSAKPRKMIKTIASFSISLPHSLSAMPLVFVPFVLFQRSPKWLCHPHTDTRSCWSDLKHGEFGHLVFCRWLFVAGGKQGRDASLFLKSVNKETLHKKCQIWKKRSSSIYLKIISNCIDKKLY